MKKDNLYRRIMENVSKGLSSVLNEDFQFDDTEIADKLLELVKKDKQIQNVVANANPTDWANVLRGMIKLIKSGNVPENPAKIANIVQLATALIRRGMNSQLQEKMKELTYEDMQYTANFLVNEIEKINGGKKAIKGDNKSEDVKENKSDVKEGETCDKCGKNPCQCENKQCSEKQCNENYKLSEARNFKGFGSGKFSKYLNENHLRIRPGRK